MWKKFVKDYFTFSQRDRTAVALLVGVFLLVALLPKLVPHSGHAPEPVDPELLRDLEKVTAGDADTAEFRYIADEEPGIPASPVYFFFDPNTASQAEWMKLGVSKKTALSIGKYVTKGGRFRHPEDLLKIYNLDKNTAHKLMPFVRIAMAEDKISFKNSPTITTESRFAADSTGTSAGSHPRKQYKEVDINNADTLAFTTLPGIGAFRAKSIVRYRDALGGFLSADQVSEVKQVPDSVYAKIRPFLSVGVSNLRRININTANFEDLVRHPYLRQPIAGAIIRYRQQHGPFKSNADLLGIHLIDRTLLDKINPYITTE